MLKDLSTDRINAIIMLTDGQNEYPPDDDLASLLEQLNGESADTSVRVFTIGYGEGADPETLQAIADASRGAYYEATDPASIERSSSARSPTSEQVAHVQADQGHRRSDLAPYDGAHWAHVRG